MRSRQQEALTLPQVGLLLCVVGCAAYMYGGMTHHQAKVLVEMTPDGQYKIGGKTVGAGAVAPPPAHRVVDRLMGPPGAIEDVYPSCRAEGECCPGGTGSDGSVTCGAADCTGPAGAAPCPGLWMKANCAATCRHEEMKKSGVPVPDGLTSCRMPVVARSSSCSGRALANGAKCTPTCSMGSTLVHHGTGSLSCENGQLQGSFACEGPLAEEVCHQKCAAAGFCCNDYKTGSNQYLSCAQGCMARWRGVSEQVCEASCHEPQEGCSRAIGGFTYFMCGSCNDLSASCHYGVPDTTPCTYGCKLSGGQGERQHAYRFTSKRGRNMGDCDGLYSLAENEGKVNGELVYINREKSKFLAFDGKSWVVSALPYLAYAKQGIPVIGYHAGGATPDGAWADYTVTEVPV